MPTPRAPSHSPDAAPFRRARLDHARELAEDYTETIAELAGPAGAARVTDIARRLGVSHVTVVRTLARLRRDRLVVDADAGGVQLTPAGRRLAAAARRRHQLVLDFLLSLGVPPSIARTDAEGMEHHASRATLTAFVRHLRAMRDG